MQDYTIQVILFEIDWPIFYTNLHELFCQCISWTNWVNSGKFMNNCWMSSYGWHENSLRRSHNYQSVRCMLLYKKVFFNHFGTVQQSRQQTLRAYCPYIYILCTHEEILMFVIDMAEVCPLCNQARAGALCA